MFGDDYQPWWKTTCCVRLQAHEKDVTYPGLVQFALSLTDSLLFVHYLALILIELRHRRQQFYVKVSTICPSAGWVFLMVVEKV